MRKGLSLPVEFVIIIIISVVALIVVLLFFFSGQTSAKSTVSAAQAQASCSIACMNDNSRLSEGWDGACVINPNTGFDPSENFCGKSFTIDGVDKTCLDIMACTLKKGENKCTITSCS